MSKTITKSLVCDVPDERRGEHAAHRTVRFGIDGKAWEKDVCGPHDRDMADALAPFVDAARPVRSTPARPASKAKRPAHVRARAADVRAWAKLNGLVTSDRGRMPDSVVAQYEAAKRGQR